MSQHSTVSLQTPDRNCVHLVLVFVRHVQDHMYDVTAFSGYTWWLSCKYTSCFHTKNPSSVSWFNNGNNVASCKTTLRAYVTLKITTRASGRKMDPAWTGNACASYCQALISEDSIRLSSVLVLSPQSVTKTNKSIRIIHRLCKMKNSSERIRADLYFCSVSILHTDSCIQVGICWLTSKGTPLRFN